MSSISRGCWRQEHTGVEPDYNLSCPHSRSRDQHSVGGHPREVRWTDSQWGKRLWQQWLRKNIYYSHVFTCSVNSFGFFFSFLVFHFPPSVVVVIWLEVWNLISLLSFFFFLSHIFYYCHRPLPLCWAFAALLSFPFFFFSFFFLCFCLFIILTFNFLNIFFLHLFLCLPFLLFLSP